MCDCDKRFSTRVILRGQLGNLDCGKSLNLVVNLFLKTNYSSSEEWYIGQLCVDKKKLLDDPYAGNLDGNKKTKSLTRSLNPVAESIRAPHEYWESSEPKFANKNIENTLVRWVSHENRR